VPHFTKWASTETFHATSSLGKKVWEGSKCTTSIHYKELNVFNISWATLHAMMGMITAGGYAWNIHN
jgi:hypothetical protein